MCQIAVIKEGGKVEYDEFEKIWNQNPDGFGFAYFKGNKWNVMKGLMDPDGAYQVLDEVQGKYPVVSHWRMASAGEVKPKLTHPFVVTLKGKRRAILFHRGHMSAFSSWNSYDELSDTAKFTLFLSSLRLTERQLILMMLSKEFQEMLGGSKFVLLLERRKDPILIGSFRVDGKRRFTDLTWKWDWRSFYNQDTGWGKRGKIVKVGKGKYEVKDYKKKKENKDSKEDGRVEGTYFRGEQFLDVVKKLSFRDKQEAYNYVTSRGGAFVFEEDGEERIIKSTDKSGNKSIILAKLYGYI